MRDPQKNDDSWGRDANHRGTYFPPDLAADLDDEPKIDDLADLSFGADSGAARERDAAMWPDDFNRPELRVSKADDPRAPTTAKDAVTWHREKASYERRLKELVVEVLERGPDDVNWLMSQLARAYNELEAVAANVHGTSESDEDGDA